MSNLRYISSVSWSRHMPDYLMSMLILGTILPICGSIIAAWFEADGIDWREWLEDMRIQKNLHDLMMEARAIRLQETDTVSISGMMTIINKD